MATPQEAPVGGLGAMAPARPAPQQQQPAQQPNPAQAAQRISGLEQEPTEEDFMQKALRNKRLQEDVLNKQIEALKNSLDARMNPPFDTSLMAAASGFLKPTRTGGFGESLGYAAEAYASDMDKALARKQAIDKAKVELLQQQALMQNKNLMFEHQLHMAGYSPSEITRLTTGPSEAPQAAGAPAGAPAAEGQAAPRTQRQPRLITDADIMLAGGINTEYGKWLLDQAKFQRDQFMSTPQGLVRKDSGQAVDTGLDVPLEAPVPFLGVQKINQRLYNDIKALDKEYPKGHPDRADAFAQYYASKGIGGVEYTPGTAGTQSVIKGLESEGQKKLRQEGESESQKLEIKRNDEQKDRIYSAGQEAFNQIVNADQLYKLATNDETKGAFGVLQKPKVREAILGAVADGIQTPKGPINFPGIETAVRKIGGTETEINAALQASRFASEIELTYARTFLKGQGSVSNNERTIVRNLGPSISDTPLVMAGKAELIKARAEYDRQVADLYYEWEKNNPGKMVKDFQRDPEFKAIQKDYNDHLAKLNDKYFPGSKTEKPATSAAPAATPAASPAAPASKPPANETPLQRFEREKREREAAKGKP